MYNDCIFEFTPALNCNISKTFNVFNINLKVQFSFRCAINGFLKTMSVVKILISLS